MKLNRIAGSRGSPESLWQQGLDACAELLQLLRLPQFGA
jgi:hypothetical protein